MLHEGLLGILGRDASEPDGRNLNLELLPDLRVRLDPVGVEDGNLVVL